MIKDRYKYLNDIYFLFIIISDTSIFFGRLYICKIHLAISSGDINHQSIHFPVISAISHLASIVSGCIDTTWMYSYNTAWCSLEFELEIFCPSSHSPFTRAIYRKMLIRLEPYSCTNIDNISLILFYLGEKSTRKYYRSNAVESEYMLCTRPVKSIDRLSMPISCTLDQKFKFWKI